MKLHHDGYLWFQVNIGSGNDRLPQGNNSLPRLKLTKFHDAVDHRQGLISYKEINP